MHFDFQQWSKKNIRTLYIILFCFLFGMSWGLFEKKPWRPFQGELRVLAIQNAVPEDILESFQIDTQIRLKITWATDPSDAINHLDYNANQFDVVTLMSHQVGRQRNLDKLLRLPDNLFARSKVSVDFRYPPHDPDGLYTIPLLWGINGYVVNSEKVEGSIDSVDGLFQDRYKKKIHIENSPLDIFALLTQTKKLDWNAVYEGNVASIEKAVSDVAGFVRAPAGDVGQGLRNGDLWIAQVDSGRASEFLDNGRFRYMIPSEGASLWTLNLAVVRGSENSKEAFALMDYLFQRQVAQDLAKTARHAVTNVDVDSIKGLGENLKPSYIRKISIRNLQYYTRVGQLDPKIQNLFKLEN